jgi:predicted DNA-binding transcriptional regulator AlpA
MGRPVGEGAQIVNVRLLNVADLAARWEVTKGTILDWHEKGRLPGAIRLGGTPKGRLRWPESSIEEIERAWGRDARTLAPVTPLHMSS